MYTLCNHERYTLQESYVGGILNPGEHLRLFPEFSGFTVFPKFPRDFRDKLPGVLPGFRL